MSLGDRRVGHTGGQDASGRNRNAAFRKIVTSTVPSEVRRVVSYDGIKHHSLPDALNDTERLVYRVLDDELVSAREIAGFAGISVEQCRRALGTLRSLGMAELERPAGRNSTNVWRRA